MPRIRFFILLLLTAFQVHALETISGTIVKIQTPNSWIGLKTDQGNVYSLLSSQSEVQDVLVKLSDGDYISGQGELSEKPSSVRMFNIEFIGLNSILGMWWTNYGFLEVRNFSKMSFYIQNNGDGVDKTVLKKNYQYSVSPSSTDSNWFLFLADNDGVYLTSVYLQGHYGQMKVYNSETGATDKVIEMTRVTP